MGYLAFVQTIKDASSQDLTALGGLDWRHWNGFSLNSTNRKTSGSGTSDLSAIGSVTADQAAGGRTVTASDPTLSSTNSGVYYGANGTTGWGVRQTVNVGTTKLKCYLLIGQFSSAVKVDISLSDSSASAISYTYSASAAYTTEGLLVQFELQADSAGQTATIDVTCSTNVDFGRLAFQAITLANATSNAGTVSIAGAGASSFAGSSTARGSLSSAGVATPSLIGRSLNPAVLAVSAAATAAYASLSNTAALLSSSGVATPSFVGGSYIRSILFAEASSAFSVISATDGAVWNSSGVGSTSFVGRVLVPALLSADGLAATSLTGSSTFRAVLEAAAAATAAFEYIEAGALILSSAGNSALQFQALSLYMANMEAVTETSALFRNATVNDVWALATPVVGTWTKNRPIRS